MPSLCAMQPASDFKRPPHSQTHSMECVPLPLLVVALQLLWYTAHLHKTCDGNEHPLVRVGPPMCNRRWCQAWEMVTEAGMRAARAVFRKLMNRGRHPLYIFEAKRERVTKRWMFYSFCLLFYVKEMMLRSDISWPGQSRDFVTKNHSQRTLHLAWVVQQRIHTAMICYDDICEIYRIPAQRLALNEWEMFCAVALRSASIDV